MLAASSASADDFVFSPKTVEISGYAGEAFSEELFIENNLTLVALVVASDVSAPLQSVVYLRNTKVNIPAGQERKLEVRGYIQHELKPGKHRGEFLLQTGTHTIEVPVSVEILDPAKRVNVGLKLTPLSDRFVPGQILKLKCDLRNFDKMPADVTLHVQLIGQDTGWVVEEYVENYTLTTEFSTVLALELSPNVKRGDYVVKGTLLHRGQTKAESTAEIALEKTLKDALVPAAKRRLNPRRIKLAAIFTPFLVVLILWYRKSHKLPFRLDLSQK